LGVQGVVPFAVEVLASDKAFGFKAFHFVVGPRRACRFRTSCRPRPGRPTVGTLPRRGTEHDQPPLEPLAGRVATELFAFGLIGAALLAASILPLSTAYSVSDIAGRPAALDDSFRDAPLFYASFGVVTVIGAGLMLIPGSWFRSWWAHR
jgi:Natural resistance-associated macrophage protein